MKPADLVGGKGSAEPKKLRRIRTPRPSPMVGKSGKGSAEPKMLRLRQQRQGCDEDVARTGGKGSAEPKMLRLRQQRQGCDEDVARTGGKGSAEPKMLRRRPCDLGLAERCRWKGQRKAQDVATARNAGWDRCGDSQTCYVRHTTKMNKTELIIAHGTSDGMKKIAESLPPYDLLRAYREARATFNTPDIVLVIHQGNDDGFISTPRSAYIEQAFRRWSEVQRAAHPLARDPAHKRLQMPADALAFWLVVEMPEQEAVGCCAIGAYLHKTESPDLVS